MKTVLIKQAKYHGSDNKTFRAYFDIHAGDDQPMKSETLHVSASTTGNRLVGATRCAAKAFKKMVEPNTSQVELENRIKLSTIDDRVGIWRAELEAI